MANKNCTNKTLDSLMKSKLKESDSKVFDCHKLNTSGIIDEKHINLNDEGSSASVDSVVEVVIDEDDVLNDDEIDEELVKISNRDGLKLKNKLFQTNTSVTSKPLKRKKFQIVRSVKKDKCPKKIILNRTFLTETNFENNDIVDIKETNKDSEKKTLIKFSDFSLKQRLEMRAKKFGIPLSQDAKKQIRAQRFAKNSLENTPLLKKKAQRFGVISTQLKAVDTQERMEKRKQRFGIITNNVPANENKKAKKSKRFRNARNKNY